MFATASIASAATADRDRTFDPLRLERMARLLEDSGDYRVVRRLPPAAPASAAPDPSIEIGLFVDVETTGLDATSHEIIEVGMVAFAFTREGEVVSSYAAYNGLRQPSFPVPTAVTALTGIDDAMLEGRSIPAADIARHLGRASLVVAHNAGFDRAFLERAFPVFRGLPWACSMADVPWRDEGLRHTSLEALATSFGFFYEAHRAVDDCRAGVEILGRRLPRSGVTVLGALLDRVRRPTLRVWAVGAPFGVKDELKRRGYRWNDGGNGGPRAWYRDVEGAQVGDERTFLEESVYGRPTNVPVVEIDALARHSDRCWRAPDAR